MATKYGYAESSELLATSGGAHIYSVIDNANVLQNGMLVKLGDVVDVENYAAAAAAATDKVVLVLNPAVVYDQSTTEKQSEVYYTIPAGTPARAYELCVDDRFAIADYMVTPATVGTAVSTSHYLVLNTTNKMYQEVDQTAGTYSADSYGFIAQIVEKVVQKGITIYRLRVLKNEFQAAAQAAAADLTDAE